MSRGALTPSPSPLGGEGSRPRERIARGVARKTVERGLWTEEEAGEFLGALGFDTLRYSTGAESREAVGAAGRR